MIKKIKKIKTLLEPLVAWGPLATAFAAYGKKWPFIHTTNETQIRKSEKLNNKYKMVVLLMKSLDTVIQADKWIGLHGDGWRGAAGWGNGVLTQTDG